MLNFDEDESEAVIKEYPPHDVIPGSTSESRDQPERPGAGRGASPDDLSPSETVRKAAKAKGPRAAPKSRGISLR